MSERENIEMFVYGTLMTGYPLHDWLKNDIFRTAKGRVKGKLFPFGDGGYPVAYIAHHEHEQDMKSFIHGEIITVKLSNTVIDCIQMETNAGYQIRWAEVELESGRHVTAMSFHWQNENHSLVGKQIASGRWADYVRCHAISKQILTNDWLRKRVVRILAEEIASTDDDAEADLHMMLFNASQTDYLIKLAKEANAIQI